MFGIGLLLSRLTRNSSYGAWGWVYFLIRVAWNLGMGWIPGVWYGVQAIRAEARQQAARPPARLRGRPAGRVSPRRSAQEQRALNRQRIETLKAAMAAQPALPAAMPSLACVAGCLLPGPASRCSPARPSAWAATPPAARSCCRARPPPPASACCSMTASAAGRGRGLPGAVTYINGVQPLGTDAFQPLPAGTLLCISQGRNSQRFRIQ